MNSIATRLIPSASHRKQRLKTSYPLTSVQPKTWHFPAHRRASQKPLQPTGIIHKSMYPHTSTALHTPLRFHNLLFPSVPGHLSVLPALEMAFRRVTALPSHLPYPELCIQQPSYCQTGELIDE
jgi:hypothetical protein